MPTALSVLGQSEKRWLLAVLMLAGLVRAAVVGFGLANFAEDPDAYRVLAESLAQTGVYGLTDPQGQGQPTAFRPPLYPYLLSWLTIDGRLAVPAVAALHMLLGVATVALTFLATRELLPASSNVPAAAAATVVAVDPILLQQSTLLMTETLATALAAVVIWWWARAESWTTWRVLLLAIFLALGYLCRPTFLVWAALIASVMLLIPRQSSRASRPIAAIHVGRRLWHASVFSAVVLGAVAIWTARNIRAIGHPVWATTHGGYTLLLGNNPLFYDYLRQGNWRSAWNPEPFLIAYSHRYQGDPAEEAFWQRQWQRPAENLPRVSEHEDDRVAYQAAKATIIRQPTMFVWSAVVRVARLWSPLPQQTPDRGWPVVIAVAGFYCLLYLAVLIGLWRIGSGVRRYSWWPVWTLVISLTLVHAIYWSNLRMRAPAIPALAILASASLLGGKHGLTRRRRE